MSFGPSNFAQRDLYRLTMRTYRETHLEKENLSLKQKISDLELRLSRALMSPARHAELKTGFAHFLVGIAKASFLRGLLRAEAGHTPVYGTDPQSGEPWTKYEIAKVFSGTQQIIARLEIATPRELRAFLPEASVTLTHRASLPKP